MMQPAADAMAEALANVTINTPTVPVIANVLAAPMTDPDEIRQNLIAQVTGTVRWRESVLYMTANGITDVYELGSGKVLAGLVRRIDKALSSAYAGTPEELAELVTKLK